MTVKVTNLFVVHETQLAVLVEDKEGEQVWIPRGQISYFLKEKGQRITIELPEWLAKAKNLDYE